MMNDFRFTLPNNIILTHDLAGTLAEAKAALGVKKAFIVTDAGIAKLPNYAYLKECMAKAGFDYVEYTDAEPNPVDTAVEDCEAKLRLTDCDCLIGFGGGSSMDTAKATNVLYCCGGDISDYYGIDKVTKPLLPYIAIPTTAGSGAEITRLLSMTDTKRQVKAQISDQKIASDIAILYPNNLLGTPKGLTMAVGYDAMTHAIEGYINRKGNAITQALALKAFELMAKNLVTFANDNQNLEAAEALQVGAMLAGMATSSIGNGDAHNIARSVGGRFHQIHHGAALAVVLPHVLDFNIDVRTKEMSDLAHAMGLDINGLTQKEAAQQFILAVQQIRDDLGMTASYKDFGADVPGCLEAIIDGATFNSENGSSAFAAPRKATHDDYVKLIMAAYEGKKVEY